VAASISSVTTMGYGNGTFVGSVNLLPTLGYGMGVAGATIVGKWSNVLHLFVGQRLALYVGQRLELETGERLELRNE